MDTSSQILVLNTRKKSALFYLRSVCNLFGARGLWRSVLPLGERHDNVMAIDEDALCGASRRKVRIEEPREFLPRNMRCSSTVLR